jgi:hypothetical protein
MFLLCCPFPYSYLCLLTSSSSSFFCSATFCRLVRPTYLVRMTAVFFGSTSSRNGTQHCQHELFPLVKSSFQNFGFVFQEFLRHNVVLAPLKAAYATKETCGDRGITALRLALVIASLSLVRERSEGKDRCGIGHRRIGLLAPRRMLRGIRLTIRCSKVGVE